MTDTTEPRGITDLRRQLVAESRAHLKTSRSYADVLTPRNVGATQADWDAFCGATGTGTYAWLVAGILRLLEQKHPETAATVAEWVEESLNSGMDWLESLNNDLDGEAAETVEAAAR